MLLSLKLELSESRKYNYQKLLTLLALLLRFGNVLFCCKCIFLHYSGQAMHRHNNREGEDMRRKKKFNISNNKRVKWSPYCLWTTCFKLQYPSSHLICWHAACISTCTKQIRFGDLDSLAASHLYLFLLVGTGQVVCSYLPAWIYMTKR